MSKRIAGIVLLLSALLLTAVAVYWLLMGNNKPAVVAAPLSERPVQLINQLQQMDASWSLAALRSQAVPDSDFDQVAGFLPKVRALRDQLLETELASEAVPESMHAALMSFIALLAAKEESIEYFKSNHAVMRNSLKYLPLSETALLKVSGKQKSATDLQTQVQSLSERLRGFLQNPTESMQDRLLNELLGMDEASVGYPPELANPLQNFVSHARVLVERKLSMNDLVSRVIDDRAVAAGNKLITDYNDLRLQQNQGLAASEQTGASRYGRITLGLVIALGALGLIGGLLLLGAKQGGMSEVAMRRAVAERTSSLERSLADAQAKVKKYAQSVAENNAGAGIDSVSGMAATMAHEINTPLGYLSSNLEVLGSGYQQVNSVMNEFQVLNHDLENMRDPDALSARLQSFRDMLNAARDGAMLDELPEIIKDMNGGVEQIESLVADLRDYGREERADQDWFDVNETIRNVLRMTGRQGGDKVELKLQLADLPKIYGSPGQIAQVLTNITNNAFQAIAEDGGAVGVTTRMNGNDEIAISVMDNGAGMDSKTKARIFEPFFTTKEPGKGTGLGLPIVRRIVQRHNGRIGLKTVPGKGTSLQVILPVNSGDA